MFYAMNAPIQIVCPHDGTLNRVPAERLGEAPRCGRCSQPLFTGTPLTLTTGDFDRHAGKSDLPLLVDFWAPWCGPCRMMAPAFEKAAQLLEPKLRVAKVNTEDEPQLAARFAIRSIPTLILFRNGRELARHSGALTSADRIAQWATSEMADQP
jgi:thioredoxin 2